MEILTKCNNALYRSLVANTSEILSAIKTSQQLFLKPALDISVIQNVLKFQLNPNLNILAGFGDFIENLSSIAILQLPSPNIAEYKDSKNLNSTTFSNSNILSNVGIKKAVLNTSNQNILTHSTNNLFDSINQSFNKNVTDSWFFSTGSNIATTTKPIFHQIKSFSILTPKYLRLNIKSINSNNPQWLKQIENVINLQCRAQEKDGLKCPGRFTFPVLKPDLKSTEPKSDAQLIISKVMDTQRVSEFINALAISTINHEKHNNERISEESLFSSDSNIHSDTRSSFFESNKNSSSISKSLSSIASDKKIIEKEKYGGIFSGITIDRLIGSVNIYHTGPSLNDDNVKLELEQAVLAALSKVLEKNLEDST